ncbi:hypothetical protein BC827DRAFT_758514 [Russula dissimulans]|nr:hypothetical protein BC827DRAFT_758514 [Russula dissimulans]
MIPISRKPSFPPPPPPPYQQKRSFRLPGEEDLHSLGLLPTASRSRPPRDPPIRLEVSPPSLQRASTPMPVVNADADERIPGPSRPRSLSASQSLVSETQRSSAPPPLPPSTSAGPSAFAYAPVPHFSHSATAVAPAPLLLSQLSIHSDPERHGQLSEPPTLSPLGHSPISRPKFRPFAALGLSRTRGPATGQITDVAEEKRQLTAEERERQAAKDRQQEAIARQASAQDMARDNVRTLVEALLRGRLPPDDERDTILSACAQECESENLDLSTVLQEMLIAGQPPIYWAIVNRAVAPESTRMAPDSLVFALLKACRPFSPATIATIREACMTASDNALLQRLFRSIPQLSHISTRDALLLGPANEEDRVDVEEKRDATASWVASIKIPRFRLRMRVSQSVSVEFVASGRIWILAFSAAVETMPDGRTENRWYVSLQLGDKSPPTTVNASLIISGALDTEEGDAGDLHNTINLCAPMSELSPGRDKAIRIRLDDSPIGLQLLNEFVVSEYVLHLLLLTTDLSVRV